MTPRLKKILIFIGAGLALYAVAGFLVAPRVLRSVLLKNLGERLATTPTLGDVRVNPFAPSVTLRKFAIPDRSGAPAIAFDELYLRASLLSPFFGAWTLDELRLTKPAVNAALLEDRTLSLMQLLRHQPGPPDTTQGEPPPVFVRRLRIIDGSLAFEDRTRTPALHKGLIPIQIELRDFTTRRDGENGYSFRARTDRQEELTWHGRFTLRPFTSTGDLRVDNLQALTLEDFLGPTPPYQFTRGSISFAANYKVDARQTPPAVGLTDMGVTIHDLALADRASGEESIGALSIETRGGTVDAGSATANLGTVTASGARVRVWMDSTGVTNLQRWAQGPVDTATGPTWVTLIPKIVAHHTELLYEDRRLTSRPTFRVHAGEVNLDGYSTKPGTNATASLACSLGTTGWTEAKGTMISGTGAVDVALDLKNFDVRELEGYTSAFARMDITRGTVDAKGRFQFNTFGYQGPLMRFTGDVSSSRFASLDGRMRQELLSWDRMQIRNLVYDYAPASTRIKEITLTKPYLRFVLGPDLISNIQTLMIPPDSLPVAFRPSPADTAVTPTEIGAVRIVNGSMYYADLSLTPNFATGVQSMNGSIRELSSAQAAHATMDLTGQVDEFSPVKIAGTINPLNSRGLTDVGVSFENIELTTFTPYSGKFMGYRIRKGKLDLDLHYAVQDRQLKGENKILIRQLSLGEKVDSKDATSLPVKFAIALLKDKNGDIDLDLPVHGDLDDPKFSVAKIIMKVLVNVIVKAVTSPFKLFGAIFGGDNEEVAPAIAFPYGSAMLDTLEIKKLDAILKGMNDRPNLRLEIEQSGMRSRDSLAVLDSRYAELIRSGPPDARSRVPDAATVVAASGRAPAGIGASDYALRLTRVYTQRVGKAPLMEKPKHKPAKGAPPDSAAVAAEVARLTSMEQGVRSSLTISPDEISQLAVERARRVQGYLLRDSTIVADRVYIVGNKGAYAPDSLGVRVGLTLTD
ncbi:MAG TPA: DUF748 domain-containing protein [Candidatus Eisenbacteria bacterium]|nr:DUF748 domain-containing protein [Candidatus Eisenbacteria bacterium]